MQQSRLLLAALISFLLLTQPVHAKQWSDASGNHKFEGNLIAASEKMAVVRNLRGRLEAYQVAELSKADQEYVTKYMESQTDDQASWNMHTWTGKDGVKFKGRVTGFGSKDLSVSYVRGDIHVNKKTLRDLDPIYQMMLPKVVSEFDDTSVKSVSELRNWGRKLRGKDKTFTVDGVMVQLERGEQVAVPLFLFCDEERTFLEQGWDTWNAKAAKDEEKQQEDFLAQTSAAEYQKSRVAEAQKDQQNQQIQMMQLGMMAVNSGMTNAWQVQLLPRPGVRARATVVVVPATNSREASAKAVAKYPGFVPGAVRQMNSRNRF